MKSIPALSFLTLALALGACSKDDTANNATAAAPASVFTAVSVQGAFAGAAIPMPR